MSFTTTQVGATEDEVMLSLVQEQLLDKAVVRPTIMDMSNEAVKGVKIIDIPKFTAAFGAPVTQNADGSTAAAFKTATLGVDQLALDQWKNLPYRIPDRISIQNKVALEVEMAQSAGQEMAKSIDSYVIAALTADAGSEIALDGLAVASSTATSITLAGINEARALLKKANVTDLGGEMTLLISVEQEKAMLNISNFIEADKYGAREALLNGEIGRVYGMRVVVSNLLADGQAFVYHRSCAAFAAQKDVSFERQRSAVTLQAWEYSFSVGYGCEVLDGGNRVVALVEGTA